MSRLTPALLAIVPASIVLGLIVGLGPLLRTPGPAIASVPSKPACR